MSDKILVVDVGIGNVGSICNMLSHIGFKAYLSNSAEELLAAKKVILPGVGAFDYGMMALKKYELVEPLRQVAANSEVKMLGICLGMQLLFEGSEEGKEPGLGLVPGIVKHFQPPDEGFKVPHMGWNIVKQSPQSRLYLENEPEPRFYFVHSYHADCNESPYAAGITHYCYDFTSAVEKDNVMGVQFHPEKSHRFGMALFKKFAEL